MSYDVQLSIDTGGDAPAVVSETRCPTYNLAPMFKEALGCGLREVAGKTGAECIPLIRSAIAAMQADPGKFKALIPPNGWGSYEGALEFFELLLDDCARHPRATLEV